MPLKQSTQVASKLPVKSIIDDRLTYVTGSYTVRNGDTTNDVVELGGLPAGSRVVDLIIHHDGIGGTVDAGILSGEFGKFDNARTCGQEFGAALSTASAGVVRLARNTTAVTPGTDDRGWGIKFLAAPTVGKVIEATLVVRPA